MRDKTTISLCMMVRDSAKTLEKAVASARPLVDEVCIIDTGSKDKTPRLARRLADVFDARPWPSDFARARNWTLDMAASDYVFVLDADEYLLRPKETAAAVRAILAKEPHLVALDLEILNLVAGGAMKDRFHQARLLKNSPLLRYTGIVHHQIVGAIKTLESQGGRWLRCQETILHTGYDLTEAEQHAKFRRRLPLYEKAARETVDLQEKNYYIYQRGVGEFLAGYARRAVGTFMLDLDFDRLRPEQEMHALSVWCKAYLLLHSRGEEIAGQKALSTVARLITKYPNPEALLIASSLAAALGRHVQSLRCLLLAYEKSGTDEWRDVPKVVIQRSIADTIRLQGYDEAADRLLHARGERADRQVRALRQTLEGMIA